MITIHAKKAVDLKTKVTGLIGKEKPYPLVLQTRFGIHTFGLRFPIDVVILDQKGVVRKIKKLQPGNIFFWNPLYDIVLELPDGTVQEKHIVVGKEVTLSFD